MKIAFDQQMGLERRGDIFTKVLIVFALFCCLNVFYFLSQAASPLIFSDAWYFLDSQILGWKQVGFDILDLFTKRTISDHAQPANKLILILNYKFSHLDFRVEALFGFLGLIFFVFIFTNLYLQHTPVSKRNLLSCASLASALLIITSLNSTEIYTWPLVTFGFIYISLGALAAIMTWNFLDGTSTVISLAITAAAFLLLGDTVTVITWISLVACVILAFPHSDNFFRQRAKKWIAATAILALGYFLAVNWTFFIEGSGQISSQVSTPMPWFDPFFYLEIIRIVFSESLIHHLHLQQYGDFEKPVSIFVATMVFGFYLRFFILLIKRDKKLSIATFLACFLLIFASISIAGIVFARVSIFGIEYLHQPRYVFTYQLIPFALLFEASITTMTKTRDKRSLEIFRTYAIGVIFVAIQISFTISAYNSIPYISQYQVNQAKAIANYAVHEDLPAGDCTPLTTPICEMEPSKRIKLLKFLEDEKLNIFNSSFQQRYKFFPFEPAAVELKIGNWGPKLAHVGAISNKLEDGSMGIWIEISGDQGLGAAQVLFAGQPAKSTAVQTRLITAAIAPENLLHMGQSDISVRQVSTGRIFPVGTFSVEAAK